MSAVHTQGAGAPPPSPDLGARSPARTTFVRAFLGNRMAVTGAAIVTVLVICALAAPVIALQNPSVVNPPIRLQPPSAQHWLGTDNFGRDLFSRLIYGARVSLEVGAFVVIFTTVAGAVVGVVSGYFRVWDNILMRINDALMAIPPILLAIALMAVLGQRMSNVVLALSVAYLPQLARIVRSEVLILRESTFAEAVKSEGASEARVAIRHILPNALSPIIVQATVTFAGAVLSEAGLSYLGVGVPPYIPSWGGLLSEGHDYMFQAPWMTLYPGLAIVLCVLGLNLLGDGLRDLLDPRLRR